MTAPAVASITATIFDADTTEHLVAMPAAVDTGDVLLVLFGSDSNDAVATPTGWTVQWAGAGVGVQMRLAGYTKVSDGSEGGTTVDFVTADVESAVAQVYRVTGVVDGLTGVLDGAVATGTSNAPNPPNLTLSWGLDNDSLVVACALFGGGLSVDSYSSGYGNGTLTAGTEWTLASCRDEVLATAEDPGAWDLSGATSPNWAAQTVGFKGSAPAGASPFALPELGVTAALMRY